jgi:hypothetical protein
LSEGEISRVNCLAAATLFRQNGQGGGDNFRFAASFSPTIHELTKFAETRARFSVALAAESLCLKRGNHFVKNVLSKTFIKRSVTLQPSEEQGTTKHIDQQFWIGRRLQFS